MKAAARTTKALSWQELEVLSAAATAAADFVQGINPRIEYHWVLLHPIPNNLILPHGLPNQTPNTGPTNSHATLRLFGQPEASVRTVLYRDHHAWCPYCQKIWLWLEEMRVPYVIEHAHAAILHFTTRQVKTNVDSACLSSWHTWSHNDIATMWHGLIPPGVDKHRRKQVMLTTATPSTRL